MTTVASYTDVSKNNIQEPPKIPRGDSLSVLLIEDTDTDRFIVDHIINTCFPGSQITNATTAAKAESLLSDPTNSYNVILMDLGLPDSEGPSDTYRRINPYMDKTPTIILTSIDDHVLAVEALGLGAEDYVCKTNIVKDPWLLYKKIEYAIVRHRGHAESRSVLEKKVQEKANLLDLMNGGYSVMQDQ